MSRLVKTIDRNAAGDEFKSSVVSILSLCVANRTVVDDDDDLGPDGPTCTPNGATWSKKKKDTRIKDFISSPASVLWSSCVRLRAPS